MKYLKKYESYYSDEYQDMIQDIKDICLELEDDGMTINYWKSPSENSFSLIVSNGYDYSKEVFKDIFDRIGECGKSHGWNNITIERIPASKGSTSSKIPAGGYFIKLTNYVNESISNEDKDTIDDILLELRDEGFRVEVSRDAQYHKSGRGNSTNTTEHEAVGVWIEAGEDMDPFCCNSNDVIKSCLIRLNEYAKSIGCDMHIDPEANAMEFLNLQDFADIWGDEELRIIDIIIYEKDRIIGRRNVGRNESKRQNYEAEVSPIVDMVRDILVELSDENWDDPSNRFKVKVKAIGSLSHKRDKLSIDIHRASGFIRSDVYPSLERVTSYLASEGYRKSGNDIFDGYNCNIIYRYRG